MSEKAQKQVVVTSQYFDPSHFFDDQEVLNPMERTQDHYARDLGLLAATCGLGGVFLPATCVGIAHALKQLAQGDVGGKRIMI